jgi:hypothetical protein
MTSIKIPLNTIFQNGNIIPVLDLIQIAYKLNKFNRAFGISIRYDETGKSNTYFETNCVNLSNAICAKFPSAKTVFIDPSRSAAE